MLYWAMGFTSAGKAEWILERVACMAILLCYIVGLI